MHRGGIEGVLGEVRNKYTHRVRAIWPGGAWEADAHGAVGAQNAHLARKRLVSAAVGLAQGAPRQKTPQIGRGG